MNRKASLLAPLVMTFAVSALGQRFIETVGTVDGLLSVNPQNKNIIYFVSGNTNRADGGQSIAIYDPQSSDATNDTVLKPYNYNGRFYRIMLTSTNGAAGNPGGADTMIQFNRNSAFGGDSGLTFDRTNKLLLAHGIIANGGGTNYASEITIGDLTPSTLVVANNVKKLSSMPNASGFLQNDGSGGLSWGAGGGGGSDIWTNDISSGLLYPTSGQYFQIWTNGSTYIGAGAYDTWGDITDPTLLYNLLVSSYTNGVQFAEFGAWVPFLADGTSPVLNMLTEGDMSNTNDMFVLQRVQFTDSPGKFHGASMEADMGVLNQQWFIPSPYTNVFDFLPLAQFYWNTNADNGFHDMLTFSSVSPLNTSRFLVMANVNTNVFVFSAKNPFLSISGNTGILEPIQFSNTKTNGSGIYIPFFQADNTNTPPEIGSISIVPTGSWDGTAANENGLFEVNTVIAGTETPVLESRYGSVRLAKGNPATNATDGFVYMPTMNGTPTGVPRSETTSWTPLVYDKAAHKLWSNDDGTWRSVTFAP